eukprot:TRINITY_DN4202_c0_g1_i1.p1 TRINITY_DN4202_c0_g1~~TRINITY_DN4202_c0_g1_i1.p1  ORF type:complete len:288 (-),score=64.64 TRINITY_DN4202_c0_g1_i1:94-957(-)
MGRHSKNNSAGPVFTHWEKHNTVQDSGTRKQRVTRDSMKSFDACSICLKAVVSPMADQQGHLYCKMCIYSYLLDQKRQYKLDMHKYKEGKLERAKEERVKAAEAQAEKVTRFALQQSGNLTADELMKHDQTVANAARAEKPGWDKKMKSFWLTSETPDQVKAIAKRPSKVMKSPFGKPITMKQLVTLTLTKAKDQEESIDNLGIYVCPTCLKSLNNVKGVVCITTTGTVCCQYCYDKVIKADKIDPTTSTTFTDDDILKLQAEGSSFASRAGDKAMATKKGEVARFG